MFKRYPIMMGLGTKILTAYHHPSFKHGLMVAILDSKETHEKGTQLTDEEFKRSASTIRCEMFFGDIEDLDRYIDNLELLRNQWADEVNKDDSQ